MVNSIEDYLRQFGWTDGFHIPVANEENKLLEMQVAEKQRSKQELTTLVEDLKANVNDLKEFHKNLIEQSKQNEKLVISYRQQLEKEEQLFTENQCKNEKFTADIRNMRREQKKTEERNKYLSAEVEKSTERIKMLKNNIEWGQELQEFWDNVFTDEKLKTDVIESYKMQENQKFKELELKRQNLTLEMEKCNDQLNKELDQISSVKCELQQTFKLCRKRRKEQKDLMQKWESAINILKIRDQEIQNTTQEMNILKEALRNTKSKILQQVDFEKEKIRDNIELEIKLKEIQWKINCRQKDKNIVSEELKQISDLHLENRLKLLKLESQLSGERNEVKKLRNKISEMEKLKEMLLAKKIGLQKKLKIVEKQSSSVASRIQQIEQIYQEQKNKAAALESECKKLEILVVNGKNKLNDLNKQLQNINAEIKTATSQKSVLTKEISNKKFEIKNQNELCCKIECQLEEVKLKILKVKGENCDENQIRLNEELKKLKGELIEKKQEQDGLSQQVAKVETEINFLKMDINKRSEKLVKAISDQEELELSMAGVENQIKQLADDKKEKQVEKDILRLRINQLERLLSKKSDDVLTLEKQRIELEAAVKEKMVEISAAKNVLILRKRALLKDQSEIKKNIECISLHINQLIKRYEIIMDSMGKDEDGEALTIINYRIQMVKKRAELLEKGDDLDNSIRKIEKEIQAMENTRQLVNAVNDQYKQKNLQVSDITESEYNEVKNMEKEFSELSSCVKKNQDSILKLKSTYQELTNVENQQKIELEKLKELQNSKEIELECVKQNINEQKKKMDNLKDRNACLEKSKKKWATPFEPNLVIRDINVRIMQEFNQKALLELAELTVVHPETAPVIKQYLLERSIALPTAFCRSSKRSTTVVFGTGSVCSRPASKLSVNSETSQATENSFVATNVINIDSSVLDISSSKSSAKNIFQKRRFL